MLGPILAGRLIGFAFEDNAHVLGVIEAGKKCSLLPRELISAKQLIVIDVHHSDLLGDEQ